MLPKAVIDGASFIIPAIARFAVSEITPPFSIWFMPSFIMKPWLKRHRLQRNRSGRNGADGLLRSVSLPGFLQRQELRWQAAYSEGPGEKDRMEMIP